MGIAGLLPFLKDISKNCHISELRGSTIAIDSYCWLHKGSIACAEQLARGEDSDLYLNYCLKYVTLLQTYGIKPILVFDGQRLPAKAETEAKRRQNRKFALATGKDLLRTGKCTEARQLFKQCVDITHKMALKLITECRRRSIDCIVAPYEADAQLAHLSKEGIADYIITEDSDLILFGCQKIIFKLGLDGSGCLVEQSKLYLGMKMRPEEYTFDKFRYMCIMSGCDYLSSLSGVGLKRAHRAISMTAEPDIYKLLPKLPRYLNMKNLVVTPEYIEKFKLADATFKHQIVYNPITRTLQPLIDPASCGTDEKYLENAGEIFPADVAFQLAIGNIDPNSKEVMDNWNPDELGTMGTSAIASTSIWSRNYKKSENLPKITSNTTATSSTTVKNVLWSTSTISDLQKQQKSEYDKNLNEELKIYSAHPTAKRRKVDEEDLSETHSHQQPSRSQIQSNNPFIKSNRKVISKFAQTRLDNCNSIVKSHFFNDYSIKQLFLDSDRETTNTSPDMSSEKSNESISSQSLITHATVKENSDSECETVRKPSNENDSVENSGELFIKTENWQTEILREVQNSQSVIATVIKPPTESISLENNAETFIKTRDPLTETVKNSQNGDDPKSRESPITVPSSPDEKSSPVLLRIKKTAIRRTYSFMKRTKKIFAEETNHQSIYENEDTSNAKNNRDGNSQWEIENISHPGSPISIPNSPGEQTSPVLPHIRHIKGKPFAIGRMYDTMLPTKKKLIHPESDLFSNGSEGVDSTTNNSAEGHQIPSENIATYERIDLDLHLQSDTENITPESSIAINEPVLDAEGSVVYVTEGAASIGVRNENLTLQRQQQQKSSSQRQQQQKSSSQRQQQQKSSAKKNSDQPRITSFFKRMDTKK